MAQIYDSLKNLINSEMISKAATTLGEDRNKVASASKIILPVLLAKLLKEGNTSQLSNIIEESGTKKVASYCGNLYAGQNYPDNKNYGEKFENALLGVDNASFKSAVASKSGISKESAGKLSNWIAATVAGYFGDRVVNGNCTLGGLVSSLADDKAALRNDIPADMIRSLGLANTLGLDTKAGTKVSEPKKNNNWIWWLLLALLLLVILFFWMRSCNRNDVRNDYRTDNRIENTTPAVPVNTIDDNARVADGSRYDVTLPDGKKISLKKNGGADRLVSFLKSGDYKTDSEDKLKKKWFEFEEIEFEHGSSTNLIGNSQAYLNNIASILINYDDAKIMVAGFADKTGSEKVNMNISIDRANFIKSQLVKAGVPAANIKTEGFGERYADVAEGASDAARAEDRDVAMRFYR